MLRLILPLLLAHNISSANDKLVLTTQNTLTFRGPVTAGSVAQLQNKLYDLVTNRGNKNYTIYLVLDTPGGSILDGNSFIQFAKTINNLSTVTIVSASMGASIVQSLPGERLITDNGIMMFHRAAGGFQGYFETGEVEARLDFAKQIVRKLEQVQANRIGLSLADYKAKAVTEWFSVAENAVAQKTADRVVDIYCTPELIATKEIVNIQFLIFNVKLSFSGCPIFRAPTEEAQEGEEE